MRHSKRVLVLFFLFFINNVWGQCLSEDGQRIISPKNCYKILCKHVTLLKIFGRLNKNKTIVDFGKSEGFPFFLDNFEYTHPIMRICVENMVKKASLEPMFKTWDFSYSMDLNMSDISFLREFSILIFTLYENLLVMIDIEKTGIIKARGSLEAIIQLYNTVAKMPLREIIIALEKCYVIFSGILGDYGIYSKMSWVDWFKTYWWVAPTIVAATIGALLTRTTLRPGGFGRKSKPCSDHKN